MTVRLLHRGPTHVTLARPTTIELPPDVQTVVELVWSRQQGLFNGTLISVVDIEGSAVLTRKAEYRHFVAQRESPELRPRLRVRPLAVSGLVETADGRWLFGRRGARVTQYPFHLEAVPSGSLDDRAFGGRPAEPGVSLDPVRCLVAELEEESGIESHVIAEICPVGLFLDVEEDTFDLAYVIRLNLTAAELEVTLARARKGVEYDGLRALASEEVIVAMRDTPVVPTTFFLWEAVIGVPESASR